MIEVKVKVSNEDQSLVRDYLLYKEDVTLSKDDPELKGMVESTIADFKGQVDDVVLKIKMVW